MHDWFMLLVGLGAFAGGTVLWLRDQRLRSIAAAAEGTVTDLRRGTRGGTAPVVTFRTASGQEVVWPSTTYSSVVNHGVGQRVRILYDPANALDATIAGSVLSRLGPAIPFVGGVVLAYYGLHGPFRPT